MGLPKAALASVAISLVAMLAVAAVGLVNTSFALAVGTAIMVGAAILSWPLAVIRAQSKRALQALAVVLVTLLSACAVTVWQVQNQFLEIDGQTVHDLGSVGPAFFDDWIWVWVGLVIPGLLLAALICSGRNRPPSAVVKE